MVENITPLTQGFGYLVESSDHRELSRIDRHILIDLYKRGGVILFRGFQTDDTIFCAFANTFSESIVHPNTYRERVSEDGKLMAVDPDETPIIVHQEMGYVPYTPEVLWFWCVRPADKGGETTIVDGVDVFKQLDDSTRDLLHGQKLKYTLHFSLSVFQKQHDLSSLKAAKEVLAGWERQGLTWRINEHGEVVATYLVSAIRQTKFGSHPAIVTSFLLAGQGAPTVVFEDDSPIPQLIRWELIDITETNAFPLAWRAGDVLMIDNSRFMHGRRGFRDPKRRILSLVANTTFDPRSAGS